MLEDEVPESMVATLPASSSHVLSVAVIEPSSVPPYSSDIGEDSSGWSRHPALGASAGHSRARRVQLRASGRSYGVSCPAAANRVLLPGPRDKGQYEDFIG